MGFLAALLCMAVMLPTTCEGLYETPKFSCPESASVCETSLVISETLSMYTGKILVWPHKGKLYKYNVTDPENATVYDTVPLDKVIVGDGYYQNPRLVVSVNGSSPGPILEVYENQTLVVHVINHMFNQDVTIHWHGMYQRGTPWMDGVPMVTQCPILPGQTFTYRFRAQPAGTHWYHSHIPNQRVNGLYGALIVKRRNPRPIDLHPYHVMQLLDWTHDWDNNLGHAKMVQGVYQGKEKAGGSVSPAGSFYSMKVFQAGVLNGLGRYYDPTTGENNGSPLYKYMVDPGTTYRFRVVSATNTFPFRVTVDNHNMTVVASDGYECEPYEAESFVINTGERFDFLIKTDQPISTYYIRALSLEVDKPYHRAEAILIYQGADEDQEPTTEQNSCSSSAPCTVVNCPFSQWGNDSRINCIPISDLRSIEDDETRDYNQKISNAEPQQKFLTFAFPGTIWTPGAVNGRAFREPSVAALTQFDELSTLCNDTACPPDAICKCTQVTRADLGRVVYAVLLNMGSGKGWDHPIHLHGQRFEVLKLGFPDHHSTTGQLLKDKDNSDIKCDHAFCSNATWSNSSWFADNVPGIVRKNPVYKDTVIVPTGGYAYIRFMADNPGLWFMHCHVELHALDGMSIIMGTGWEHAPKPPKGFPKCQNFNMPATAIVDGETDSVAPIDQPVSVTSPTKPTTSPKSTIMTSDGPTESDSDKIYRPEVFWGVVGGLLLLILVLIVVIACQCCRSQESVNISGKY